MLQYERKCRPKLLHKISFYVNSVTTTTINATITITTAITTKSRRTNNKP